MNMLKPSEAFGWLVERSKIKHLQENDNGASINALRGNSICSNISRLYALPINTAVNWVKRCPNGLLVGSKPLTNIQKKAQSVKSDTK